MHNFYIYPGSWITPALLGLLVYFVAYLLNHSFYYIHLYLIIAGIITLLTSFVKFATTDRERLNLYYGPPIFRKNLPLSWSRIELIEPQTIERRSFVSSADCGGVVTSYRKISILIRLNQKLHNETLSSIKLHNLFSLKKGIEISSDGLEISIMTAPKCGFKAFISILSKYVTVKNFEAIEPIELIDKFKFTNLQRFVLFLILVYFFSLSYQLTG